jgi:hypothetical protein
MKRAALASTTPSKEIRNQAITIESSSPKNNGKARTSEPVAMST